GRRSDALAVAAKLRRALGGAPVTPYYSAEVYAGLGDRESALALVKEARRERSPVIPLRLAVDPRMEELRNDPRVREILKELGFDPQAPAGAPAARSPSAGAATR